MKILLSSADASRVLGITPAAVRQIARRGELRAVAMTEGGIQLFQRTDVERLAKRRASGRKVIAGGGGKNDGKEENTSATES